MNALGFKNPAEAWAIVSIGIAGAVLFAALVLEHWLELTPCPLCLMQRIWVFFVGAFAFLGLLHNPRFGIYPLLGIGSGLVGGGFSIRQLYLQSLPADQVPACGPDITYMLEAFPLSDVLAAMTRGTGDCATVVWQFLGLSIPAWALLGFVVLIGVSFLQLRAAMR